MTTLDLIYKEIDNKKLYLTFLPPLKRVYKSAPLYFIIPGGGWHMEKREDMIDFSKLSVEMLRNEGYAVVSIDYRVTDEDNVTMREIISDCFDALKYITKNSEKLGIDKNNIITSGHSAGAHLALMLAYTYKNTVPDCTVTAAAGLSAPTILYRNDTHALRDIGQVFAQNDSEEERKSASPYDYVTPYCPPTILCAGTSDRLVFSNSSELLYKKLCENHVDSKLVLSIGGGHSFEKMHDTVELNLSGSDIQKIITGFILDHTKMKSELL